MELRVELRGVTLNGIDDARLTLKRDRDQSPNVVLAQVVVPGVDGGTPVQMSAAELLEAMQGLFPEFQVLVAPTASLSFQQSPESSSPQKESTPEVLHD